MKNKYAYFTIASGNSYLNGAVGLAYGLKQVQAEYPLIVGVSNCSEAALSMLDDCNIEYIQLPEDYFYINNSEYHNNYSSTLQKFYCLNFKEYDKIMFLDADMIPLVNPDGLFKKDCNNSFVFQDFQHLGGHSFLQYYIFGGCFIISPNNFYYSYDEIKKYGTEITQTELDDEYILNLIVRLHPELIKGFLFDIEDKIISIAHGELTKPLEEGYFFHDSNIRDKKLFLNFNYFFIIDSLQNYECPSFLIKE